MTPALKPSSVSITRSFAATCPVIFEAWLEPEVIRCWLFTSPANEIREVGVDPRPGGTFSIVEWSDRERIDHFGEFQALVRPHRLAFTLQVPKHFPGITHVSVELAPSASGCVMTFTQTGVDREVTEASWHTMFDTLARITEPSEA
jgi:uncharacterized protein YndB with AHSA1/START domain